MSDNKLETVREDDFVEYFIFPNINIENLSDDYEEKYLDDLSEKIITFTNDKSKNYIWHKDVFCIKPLTRRSILLSESPTNTEHISCLHGITHYGENIEDEWFIVYLLKEITREFEDIIVRVIDIDGEFPLIESAEHLPENANPENCDQKVYFYRGKLHLVPLDYYTEGTIPIHDALQYIRANPNKTELSENMQQCIQNRIKNYTNSISENLHRATLYLPVGIAAILHKEPKLLAAAVRAFCNRDAIDLKACRAMKYFPPENRIMTSIIFTKCLYAMLSHGNYHPDRRTGWNLPSTNSTEYKAHNLGMRVACGFEILISQAKNDVSNDKQWNLYVDSLKMKGYFNDLLPESKQYGDLLNKAKEYYRVHVDTRQNAPTIGQMILELTKTLEFNIDDLKKGEANLQKEDDDSWLNLDPNELNRMLQERYGQKKIFKVNENTDACRFTEKIKHFLSNVSDFEGAEFPDSLEKEGEGFSAPIRPQRKNKKNIGKLENSESPQKVSFDAKSFSCAVQNILDLVIPEDNWDLESGSEMSDYENESEINLDEKMSGDAKLKEYMDQMDKELSSTTIGQSFESKQPDTSDNFDDIENFQPVDIDRNTLKNIMESYRSQMGTAGPASTLLGPMGVHLETGLQEINLDDD